MDVMAKGQELERQGRQVVHLEFGEPDFATPPCVCEAALEAMREGKTHYTHSLGILPLREAIAEDYAATYGVEVSPEQILITAGVSPAMLVTATALLDHGDEIIISDPHYPCYPNFIRAVGGEPAFVEVDEEDGFEFRLDAIKARLTPRTKAILVNSPSNPTGARLSVGTLRAIADLGLHVVSDEIYHALVYGGEQEHSILEFTDKCIVVNSFSKRFAMTGWRLGYAIVPPEFVRPMQRIAMNLFLSTNEFVQWSGIVALRAAQGHARTMCKEYDERRRFMLRRLREIGFRVAREPEGAFYIFANAGHFGQDSRKLAFELLAEAGLATAPGIDFGEHGEGFLRFSYASSIENIALGMDRLEDYLKGRRTS
jgi:aspartate/methionine/tyrosine aminotransferase